MYNNSIKGIFIRSDHNDKAHIWRTSQMKYYSIANMETEQIRRADYNKSFLI